MLTTERPHDFLAFTLYFIGLRLRIALGQYYTANPIDLGWRWRHWQQIKHLKEKETIRHRPA